VVLVSRNTEKLTALVDELSSEGIKAEALSGDAAEAQSIKSLFDTVRSKYPSIDVVHYNAAAVSFNNILNETADTLTQDFKVNVAGLQSATLNSIDALSESKGAILVTGGGFAMYPYPDFGSLSVGKAGIRNLADSLHQTLKEKCIFVGTVTVKGIVSPDAEVHNPNNIAAHFWKLYSDRTDFEIQL
jgi:short-subunit dehydrogenase